MLDMNSLERDEYNRLRADLEKWIIDGAEHQLNNLQIYMKNRMAYKNDPNLFQTVRDHIYDNFHYHMENIEYDYGRESEQYERARMLTGSLFDDRLKAAQAQAEAIIAEKVQAEIAENLAQIEKLTRDLPESKPTEQQPQPRRSFTAGFDTAKVATQTSTPKGNTLDELKAKAQELAPDVTSKKLRGHSGVIHKKQKYHEIPSSGSNESINGYILLAIQHRIEGLQKQKTNPERKNRIEALEHFANTFLAQDLSKSVDIANVYKQAIHSANDEDKFKAGTSFDSSGHGNKSEFHNLVRHISKNNSQVIDKISVQNPPIEKESKKSRGLKGGS